MDTLFHTCALVAVAATLVAITRPEPVHALLNLIVSVLAAAGVMLSLGASLAAALQVMLYAGAILVLFVFVVMLIQPGTASRDRERAWLAPSNWLLPAVMSAVVLAALLLNLGSTKLGDATSEVAIKAVGVHFYGPYLLAVELGSFLLLAGLVSAWRIGRPVERS